MKKLLIVSDSRRFRAWARLIVEAEGHAVLEARDGLAALQYAVEEGPSMILIDPDLAPGRAARPQATARPAAGAIRPSSTAPGVLSAEDIRARLCGEPATEGIPVVLPASAFVRGAGVRGHAGASDRSMRRSTATLSLRETICRVLHPHAAVPSDNAVERVIS